MEKHAEASRTEHVLSPWVTLVTHHVRFAGSPQVHDFHSLKQADYVTMFAVTTDGKIPLVRQYRPALDRITLELPSGLLEAGEQPEQAAERELLEETGLAAGSKVESLGSWTPDTARLGNRLWGFFVSGVSPEKAVGWQPDLQVECLLVTKAEFKNLVLTGQFEHALNLAVIGQATARGFFSFD